MYVAKMYVAYFQNVCSVLTNYWVYTDSHFGPVYVSIGNIQSRLKVVNLTQSTICIHVLLHFVQILLRTTLLIFKLL